MKTNFVLAFAVILFATILFIRFTLADTSSLNQSADNFSNSTVINHNVIAFVKITLHNSQNVPTANAFQQLIVVNSTKYSKYINSNWTNVEFSTGKNASGKILKAWVESNASNTSTHTDVWVLLSKSIGAGSSTKIYINFMKSNVMSIKGPTGEAPQLSPTYAQYDDGAKVFIYYENFAGTSCPTGWRCNSSVENDSIYLPINSSAVTIKRYGLNASQVLDFDAVSLVERIQGAGPSFAGYTNTTGKYAYINSNWQDAVAFLGGPYSEAYFGSVTRNGTSVNSSVYLDYRGGIGTAYYASKNYTAFAKDYGQLSVLHTNSSLGKLPIGFSDAGTTYNGEQHYQWIRIREYPPNGVMPTVTFGK